MTAAVRTRSTRKRGLRLAVVGAAAAVLAVTLSACSANSQLAADYREGSNKGYISGQFQVVEIPEGERGEPIEFEGVTEHGDDVSSADYDGEILVVNFWFAACGPCIVEAPFLEEVYQEYREDGVDFLGVNTYDQAPTALSFARDNDISYPSVIDINDKKVGFAFAQATPIQATPTTLVLDREGRVAARVIGQLSGASILSTIVADVAAEGS